VESILFFLLATELTVYTCTCLIFATVLAKVIYVIPLVNRDAKLGFTMMNVLKVLDLIEVDLCIGALAGGKWWSCLLNWRSRWADASLIGGVVELVPPRILDHVTYIGRPICCS
jgi:hypothetical protein